MSHQYSTATPLCHTLPDFHSVRTLDIVTTMPTRSSVAKFRQDTSYRRLGNCSDTSDRCIALLRSAGPLHIHVHIATKSARHQG